MRIYVHCIWNNTTISKLEARSTVIKKDDNSAKVVQARISKTRWTFAALNNIWKSSKHWDKKQTKNLQKQRSGSILVWGRIMEYHHKSLTRCLTQFFIEYFYYKPSPIRNFIRGQTPYLYPKPSKEGNWYCKFAECILDPPGKRDMPKETRRRYQDTKLNVGPSTAGRNSSLVIFLWHCTQGQRGLGS